MTQPNAPLGPQSTDSLNHTIVAPQPIHVEARFPSPVEVVATLKPADGEAGIQHIRMDPSTQNVKLAGTLPVQIEAATQPIMFDLAHPIHVDIAMHMEQVRPTTCPSPEGKHTNNNQGTPSTVPSDPTTAGGQTPASSGVWWTNCFGAVCFGIVIGWITYRSIRRAPTTGLSDISTVIAAVGGSTVVALFPAQTGVFGAYCIGLALGFFGYLGAALKIDGKKSVSLWLGAAPVGPVNPNAAPQIFKPPS